MKEMCTCAESTVSVEFEVFGHVQGIRFLPSVYIKKVAMILKLFQVSISLNIVKKFVNNLVYRVGWKTRKKEPFAEKFKELEQALIKCEYCKVIFNVNLTLSILNLLITFSALGLMIIIKTL